MSEEIRLNHLPSAYILPGIKISDIYRQTNKPKHNMNDKDEVMFSVLGKLVEGFRVCEH